MSTHIALGHEHAAPTDGISIEPSEPAATSTRSDGRRAQVRLDALALATWPAAMAAFAALDDAGLPREAPEEYLGNIAEAPGRFLAGTLCYLVGAILFVLGAPALRRVLGGTRLGRVAVTLMTIGSVVAAGIAGAKVVVRELVTDGGPGVSQAAIDAYTRFQDGIGFAVVVDPILLTAGIGSLLGLVALWRSRVVPAWVPLVIFAGFVLASGEISVVANVVGWVVQGIGWVVVAGAAMSSAAARRLDG